LMQFPTIRWGKRFTDLLNLPLLPEDNT
jgi:hypothetical protein